MFQDSILLKQRQERFIKKVCESEVVWALENEDGYATSSSNELEDEDGNPIGLICFWADKARAKSCIIDDWLEYKCVEVDLCDFIENWCIGMSNDGLLIGSDFDSNLFGSEIDPLDMIIEIGKELNIQNKQIKLSKYKQLDDLVREVEESRSK